MNWIRAIIAGVAGGIAVSVADFVMHGMIMESTYRRYPEVFTQEPANPVWFFAVSIFIAIPTALLFARTSNVWSESVMGGLRFGFWLGVALFFTSFYWPLVLEGFPYFLSWCWAGINFIDYVILGAVVGALYRGPAPRAAAEE